MKEFEFKKIDAFASETSDGNPAGYVLLNNKEDINDSEMLKIAQELKGYVNEVGYTFRESEKCFNLRYFSAEREVDFCGHATIAIMYDLIKSNIDLQKYSSLKIATKNAILTVENRIEQEDAVFIMSPKPIYKDILPNINILCEKLNISSTEIGTNYPVSVINAGLTTLLVPINTLGSILNISPNLEELKKFCFHLGVDIIEVFTKNVVSKENNFRTRVFCPKFGYMEDPATGSGNSAFGYYLLKYELWENETIKIEQNKFKNRYNIIKLQKQTDLDGNDRVLFGGGAITRIEGKYILY